MRTAVLPSRRSGRLWLVLALVAGVITVLPATPVVAVTARLSSDGLTVSVRDHGPGIGAADLPHLFDRFYRGAASKTRAVSGFM